MMTTLRIYSLNYFCTYHTAVFITFIMWQVTSLVLIYLLTGSLYPLTTFIQFPIPSQPPPPHLW